MQRDINGLWERACGVAGAGAGGAAGVCPPPSPPLPAGADRVAARLQPRSLPRTPSPPNPLARAPHHPAPARTSPAGPVQQTLEASAAGLTRGLKGERHAPPRPTTPRHSLPPHATPRLSLGPALLQSLTCSPYLSSSEAVQCQGVKIRKLLHTVPCHR